MNTKILKNLKAARRNMEIVERNLKIAAILMTIVLGLSVYQICFAADGWVKTKPAGGDNPATIDNSVGENNAAIDLMLSTFTNCKLTYVSATTVSVSAGGVMVSNSAGTVRLMLANAAATSVTFTDIDTGAEAPSTTYYVYAIASATIDTVFTCKISASGTAPTGVTYYKRIGSFYNDASSNVTQVIGDDPVSDGVVSTLKLKTTTGEVSSTGANLTLPGGEYGFYPQVKQSGGTYIDASISGIVGSLSGVTSTSYVTSLSVYGQGGATGYAQQRYVTASGKDWWLFLLIDKNTKEIISSYSAADHPAYGNGGDFDKMPHPFRDYFDKALPNNLEIVLLDNDSIKELKSQVTKDRSMLTILNEDYFLDLAKKKNYVPLHSGRFIDKDPEMVNSIPDYIVVRGIKKLTLSDKQQNQLKQQDKLTKYNEKIAEEKLVQDEIRKQAVDALKAEGVTLKYN